MAQSAVPIEREPAHRLVLQNGHIRVFEVWLPPGEHTLWHVHRHDGISVRLTDASIEDQAQEGQAKTLQLRRGAVAYGATPTALTHRVRNVGETAFHNIYIELLADHGTANGHSATGAHQQAAFENERVRALRRTLAPDEATTMHTHVSSGVVVLVSKGRLQITGSETAASTGEEKAGAVQWIESVATHALKNVGAAPIEIVEIELK